MKKRIVTAALTGFIACSSIHATPSNASGKVILDSKMLAIVDGSIIDADTIEMIRKFQRKIIELLIGDLQNDGKRIGHYQFQAKNYGIHELVTKEIEYQPKRNGNPVNPKPQEELAQLLEQAKDDFIITSDEFRIMIAGQKPTMAMLVKDSCTKRNRLDSLLLKWSELSEDEEIPVFRKNVPNFAVLKSFYLDLLNFLKDLVDNCPKAHRQFEQRVKKFKKVKELIPEVLTSFHNTDMENQVDEFLKYVKSEHLDTLSLETIDQHKVRSLITSFITQNEQTPPIDGDR